MGILEKIRNWITDEQMAMEAYYRFVKPQTDRLKALGVSQGNIDKMIKRAIKDSNPSIVGGAPSSVLRNMADRIEAGEAAEDILINAYFDSESRS